MNIGACTPLVGANATYRSILPMREMARRGHTVRTAVVSPRSPLPPIEAMLRFDVIYLWQLYGPPIRRLVKALRDGGVAVTWDSDDDVLSIPRGAPNYREAGGAKGQQLWADMQGTFRVCHTVTTPSEVLAEKFRATGQEHVRVIENLLPNVRWARTPQPGRVVIGWCGLLEHATDIEELGLRPALRRVMELRQEVHVETVGLTLDLDGPRYRHTGIVGFDELPQYQTRFDIGLAPLADKPFNRSRSNIKLKEYAALGIPWLASAMEPYEGLGEQQGGRLVEAGGWFDALLALVDDAAARQRLAANAHAWAQQETLSVRGGEWEEMFEEAIERARPSARAVAEPRR